MRTTITLDPDVAKAIRERMRRLGQSFRQVVNDTLREGLGGGPSSARQTRFRVQPRSAGFRPGIDPTRLNQLVDELEQADGAKARSGSKR